MIEPSSGREPWRPTRLVRVIESYDTLMGTTRVKTDATFCYVKALGNRQGPHCLASELVASSLARWFGLTVPDFALLPLSNDDCFSLPRGARIRPGPAFVSRHVPGRTWGGSAVELVSVENPGDITRLVVFDTWLRNCDRHPPDLAKRKPNYANVYLADTESPGRLRLTAIDHTHCFDCGRDLTERLAGIENVKDESTFGLFPAFRPYLDAGELAWCKSLLRSVTLELAEEHLRLVPPEWQVPARAAAASARFIHGRAGFVADMIDCGWPIG